MSDTLVCTLLGPPQVSLESSAALDLGWRPAQAVFFYLVVTGQPQRREALAHLLWPDRPEAQGKANLRNVLPRLRQVLGPHLHITREVVAFNREQPYWLDVEQFRRLLETPPATWERAALLQAVKLYRGAFLEGFTVRQAPAFDDWLASQREALHTLVVRGLEALIEHDVAHGEDDAGLAHTQRL